MMIPDFKGKIKLSYEFDYELEADDITYISVYFVGNGIIKTTGEQIKFRSEEE